MKKRKRMRQVLAVVMILLLGALSAPSAVHAAEEIMGTTASEKIFYVYAQSSASWISLYSYEGSASVYGFDSQRRYVKNESLCGFYTVTVSDGYGRGVTYEWTPDADVFDGGAETGRTLGIAFPGPGNYTVRVIPYAPDQITGCWQMDVFDRWLNDAVWRLDTEYGCTVSFSGPQPVATAAPVSSSIPRLPAGSVPVSLRNPHVERIRPQCGPGYGYAVFASMNGSTKLYKPGSITYLRACFLVGDWVYIEFGYTDGVRRYGFFEQSLFSCSDWGSVPHYSLSTEKHGTVTREVTPFNGPGQDCGSYPSCKLRSGDTVHACMECDGWYLCRFYNGHGNRYGDVYLWVPGSGIRWK